MCADNIGCTKHASENQRTGTYSGGNKKNSSVAIAMIDNPPLHFWMNHQQEWIQWLGDQCWNSFEQ